jgi:hypothetical protein
MGRSLTLKRVAPDVPVEIGIEFAVLQSGLDGDRTGEIIREMQTVLHQDCRTRRDLMIVERDEDVLDIATIDPVAVAIQDIGVDEVGPGVDRAIRRARTRATEQPIAGTQGDVEPKLVRVCRPLGEVMPHSDGAHHKLEQIAPPWLQARQLGANRSQQRAIDGPPFAEPEDIKTRGALQHGRPRGILLGWASEQRGYGCVGGSEQMVVDRLGRGVGERARGRIVGRPERHVAGVTGVGRPIGIVEAVDTMPGDPAQ